ncbi:MAG: hypothetical protein WBC74_06000 [Candidatus Omnitrophota bacterium]
METRCKICDDTYAGKGFMCPACDGQELPDIVLRISSKIEFLLRSREALKERIEEARNARMWKKKI